MSQSSSVKSEPAQSAIDLYDERVRKLIELWQAEIGGVYAPRRKAPALTKPTE